MRVMRIYHGGRDAGHRARERALVAAGVEVTLVVPRSWPDDGSEHVLSEERFQIVELDVQRAGDVNRHSYADADELRRLISDVGPDVLDVHEEPFSEAGRKAIAAAPAGLPVVMYTAQNVDKRLPPPYSLYERRAHRRAASLYPCSRQAAAVARGKGFAGLIEVIPLGFDPELFHPGRQSLNDDVVTLALVGRLVPEKGVLDAVHVLARANEARPSRLVLVGSGPEEGRARELAVQLGVGDRVDVVSWAAPHEVADICRRAHVVLVPSVPTETWTEQFGRVIVEAQASGAVVAGYATGSIPEIGGEAAALVSAHDIERLAAAVLRVTSDPDEFEERRRRGFELSAGRSWSVVGASQVSLYERVVARPLGRATLPRSPRGRRAAARSEFGETAPTSAGSRPFALPVLRRGGPLPRALGRAIDAIAEMRVGILGRLGL